MDKINLELKNAFNGIPVAIILASIGVFELVSYCGSVFPIINTIGVLVVVGATLVLSLKNLRYGVWILFTELVIGSKGYLFSFSIGDQEISLRLFIFLVLTIAGAWSMIHTKHIAFLHWVFWKEYAAIALIIAIAVLIGVVNGNPLVTIFLDANGYLYIGAIIILTQAIQTKHHLHQLLGVVVIATIALMVKTLAILFLFSQLSVLPYTLPGIYSWIRDTGVGEITRFPNGFSRIFFQSHLYALLLFFVSLPLLLQLAMQSIKLLISKSLRRYIIFGIGLLMTIFISYSRSFWVATAGAGMIGIVTVLLRKRLSWIQLLRSSLLIGGMGVSALALTWILINIPLPGHKGVNASSLITERTSQLSNEPAAASRWQLIGPLWQATTQHAIIGSGLGSTVTYTSADPRVLLDHPDGQYTTYAFEWGYLDMLYKFGFLGSGILLLLCWRIGRALLQGNTWLENGLLWSALCLGIVHVFTPYLNHPLGIGWLLILSMYAAMIQKEKHIAL